MDYNFHSCAGTWMTGQESIFFTVGWRVKNDRWKLHPGRQAREAGAIK